MHDAWDKRWLTMKRLGAQARPPSSYWCRSKLRDHMPGLAQAWATVARRPARLQKKWQVACSLRSFSAMLPASMITQCGSSALVSAHFQTSLSTQRAGRLPLICSKDAAV